MGFVKIGFVWVAESHFYSARKYWGFGGQIGRDWGFGKLGSFGVFLYFEFCDFGDFSVKIHIWLRKNWVRFFSS